MPQAFGDCCGRYIDHFDTAAAPDAEHLMRSRYSAFVLQRRNYLQATWHASTRPATLDFEPDARWLGLEVRSHRALDAEHAEVEFVARYRVAGAPCACTSAAVLCVRTVAGITWRAISFEEKHLQALAG